MNNLELTKFRVTETKIVANYQLKVIEFLGEIEYFFDRDVLKLSDWIQLYQQNNIEPLELVYKQPFMQPLPLSYFPSTSEINLVGGGSFTAPRKRLSINAALDLLDKYSFYIQGADNHPSFYGNCENGLVKIMGEFYSSWSLETMIPLHAWLKMYFEKIGGDISLEFWMTYINTIAQRRFLEILQVLEVYKKTSFKQIKIYWYQLENDEDMEELGILIKKDTSLYFEIVSVSEKLWNDMNK